MSFVIMTRKNFGFAFLWQILLVLEIADVWKFNGFYIRTYKKFFSGNGFIINSCDIATLFELWSFNIFVEFKWLPMT